MYTVQESQAQPSSHQPLYNKAPLCPLCIRGPLRDKEEEEYWLSNVHAESHHGW